MVTKVSSPHGESNVDRDVPATGFLKPVAHCSLTIHQQLNSNSP
jgi:hypothetical protein